MDEHIMISYSHQNQVAANLAKRINKRLKQNNYKTWIDYEQINGSIYNAMADGIDKSFVVLVLITNEYCNNTNTVKECEYATRKNKHVIPIKVNSQIDPSNIHGIVGMAIGGILYIDFSKPDFDESMKQLLDKIRKCEQQVNNVANPSITQQQSNPVNTYKTFYLGRMKIIVINNKKLAFTIASLVIIIIALIIAIIVSFAINNRGNFCLNTIKNIKDIDIGQTEFRYSLKISDIESIAYNGSNIWNYIKNGENIESFQELKRDDEGVIVKSSNGTFRLSSLSVTVTDPQPRWKKARWNIVWKKYAENAYIYPGFATDWIEIQNDKFFSMHTLINIDVNGDTYDTYRSIIKYYFRLNSTGLYSSAISIKYATFLFNGSWIYKS